MKKVTHHGPLYTEEESKDIEDFLLGDNARWTFTGHSFQNLERFWFHPLNDIPFFSQTSVDKIKNLTGINGTLSRVYANGQTMGQNGDWHVDDPDIECGTTMIWYLNTFEDSWGGKTLFKYNDIIEYVIPKRNHLVSFPSNILHMGESPNHKFSGLRVTIAWKFCN
jgi:hypothetical protein